MAGNQADEPTDQAPLRSEAETEADLRAREHLRRSGEAAKEAARSGWAALRGSGKAVGDRSKDVVESSRESIDRGYRTVTLKTYRDELDEALSEIVDVLAAQDSEIRHLRGRVEALEGPSDDEDR